LAFWHLVFLSLPCHYPLSPHFFRPMLKIMIFQRIS